MKQLLVTYYQSVSNDPWRNLAYEEYLLNHLAQEQVVLYLWQNERTVVIGANQNPFSEVNIEKLEQEGGKLARRMSGGGAVYHDLGNLNFTFIVPKQYFNFTRQISVIISALNKLGIVAVFSGRNDIIVANKKMSGNAFYHRDLQSLHHGTILVNTDFVKMVEYLNVDSDKIKTKGIKSVRSRVINLQDICENLTINSLVDALRRAFIKEYAGDTVDYQELTESDFVQEELIKLENKYAEWKFRYGESPAYALRLKQRFDWGGVEFTFDIKHNSIIEVQLFTDAMDHQLSKRWREMLTGLKLSQLDFKLQVEQREDLDIKKWLLTEFRL